MPQLNQKVKWKHKKWANIELNFLKENHEYDTTQRLAEGLKRSKSSVSHKLSRLRLKSPKRIWVKQILNENHGNWKGDDVGYGALHDWIKRRLEKPKNCELCKKETSSMDLANKSGLYKRDLKDWIWLCRSCHMKSDNRIFNLNQFLKQDYLKQISSKCKICGRFSQGEHIHG